MIASELLKLLEETYPDSVFGIETMEDVIRLKAQLEMIEHIKLIIKGK